MPNRNDYDQIAYLYDKYVQVDIDLDFFRENTSRCSGQVLELMAGTGRVSKAIFDCSERLTCVDMSSEMLRGLNNRFAGVGKRPDVVCADVRSLPLDGGYDLVIIPFNSFLELATTEDQQKTLGEIHRVLEKTGEFICTLHNPEVRARSLDGEERLLGRFPVAGGQEFELWVRGTLDQQTGLALSQQTFLIYDKSGRLVREHLQEIRFVLIGETRFRDLCTASGFEVMKVIGDYEGSPYDRDTSPFLISTMRKVVPS